LCLRNIGLPYFHSVCCFHYTYWFSYRYLRPMLSFRRIHGYLCPQVILFQYLYASSHVTTQKQKVIPQQLEQFTQLTLRFMKHQGACPITSFLAPPCASASPFAELLSNITVRSLSDGGPTADTRRACNVLDDTMDMGMDTGLLHLTPPCRVGSNEWNEFVHNIYARVVERLWESKRPERSFAILFADGHVAWPALRYFNLGAPVHGSAWHSIYLLGNDPSSPSLCVKMCCDPELPTCLMDPCYHGCGHGFMAVASYTRIYSACDPPRRASLSIDAQAIRKAESACVVTSQITSEHCITRYHDFSWGSNYSTFTSCLGGAYHHFFKYSIRENVRREMCDGALAFGQCENFVRLSRSQSAADQAPE